MFMFWKVFRSTRLRGEAGGGVVGAGEEEGGGIGAGRDRPAHDRAGHIARADEAVGRHGPRLAAFRPAL